MFASRTTDIVSVNKIMINVMILLKNEKLGKEFNLPQSINEINFEYLKECMKDINLSKHYCIIALVTSAKVSELIDTRNNHTGTTKFVVVKHRDDCSNNVIKENEVVILPPSEAFNGIDCNTTRNELSGFNIIDFVNSDPLLKMSVAKGSIFKNVSTSAAALMVSSIDTTAKSNTLNVDTNRNATIVGFKIVPESAIIASTGMKLKESGTVKYIKAIKIVEDNVDFVLNNSK